MRPDLAIVEQVASSARPRRRHLSSNLAAATELFAASSRRAASRSTSSRWRSGSGPDASIPTRERAAHWRGGFGRARSDLFGRKKDHGRAEAALIAALYAAEQIVNGGDGQ